MSGKELQTVVQGEASESESDDEIDSHRQLDTVQSNDSKHSIGVVVSGEAPESDEEFQDVTIPRHDLPPLKVSPDQSPTKDTDITRSILHKKSKYDSLLHKKLREKNQKLFKQLEECVGCQYNASGNEVHLIAENLTKSQGAIQDVSHNMRILTNDLFHLEDKIDIIVTCSLLPDINIQPLSDAAVSGSPRSPPPSPSR